jgi:proton-translocating NADH-quinone oxidoreductase chain M
MFSLFFLYEGLFTYGILFPLIFLPCIGFFVNFSTTFILYLSKVFFSVRFEKLIANFNSHFVNIYLYLNQLFSCFIFVIIFFWSLYVWYSFDFSFNQPIFQFVFPQSIIEYSLNSSKDFYVIIPNSYFGIDGISLFFVLLTCFLFPLCFIVNFKLTLEPFYIILLFAIEILILIVFLTTDFLLFYITFELILIPMLVLILVYGSRVRKIKASYYFFIYTFLGSLCLLLALLYIMYIYKTTNFYTIYLYFQNNFFSPTCYLSLSEQTTLLILFFIGFAVKIPVFPFHLWLPEAHVEAPTVGSVILAGLLLKLGGYGFLRFVLPLVPDAITMYVDILNCFFLISIIFSCFAILRQIDLKKFIAYSSIAHMNFMLLGMFSLNYSGVVSSIILMIGHGITSSALFILIGVLYERYHSRIIYYYGGLVIPMPYFIFFFVFFNLSNFGFPGTSNFVGEFLVFLGLAQININILFFSLIGFIFSGVYSVLLINKISFGTLKISYINFYQDLLKREFFILFILVISSLLLGFFPSIVILYMHESICFLLQPFLI